MWRVPQTQCGNEGVVVGESVMHGVHDLAGQDPLVCRIFLSATGSAQISMHSRIVCVCVCARAHVCVCVRVRVCVCVCARERERVRVCVSECVYERVRV